ncbi:GNAT family N-acetyltransferase [Parendozoicomonas callyspongiae]|uniref:GNAT family N-acetyltransferase n=1 Tax=Parendozoicomonas callyspongiae TaxID=2942213 RepID=UPI0038CDB44C
MNTRDNSEAQVKAWASDHFDLEEWLKGYLSTKPFVAQIDGEIVGYADIQNSGYIDHFFCHWKHQGEGIGKALMNKIHQEAKKKGIKRMYSHVSITAKPFFEHFGFAVIKQQQVNIRGQHLTNFVMEKLF